MGMYSELVEVPSICSRVPDAKEGEKVYSLVYAGKDSNRQNSAGFHKESRNTHEHVPEQLFNMQAGQEDFDYLNLLDLGNYVTKLYKTLEEFDFNLQFVEACAKWIESTEEDRCSSYVKS